ncbi:sensor histidine kinase [Moorella sulfitireducens]|uniref:sensor histidine kinase n=1 Tax=Neomoorella sulfitireducens TaxID=2972948 RepID=UPI0021ABD345|nr:sensor histidine kinase [Moorella sulfitireducens]
MGKAGGSFLQKCPSINKKKVCPVKAEDCPCPGRRLRINVHQAQERESKRWAMELHDCIAQSLGSIILEFDTLIANKAGDKERDKIQSLNKIKNNLQNLYDSLREMLFELRAPYMEGGLAESLRNYLEQVAARSGTKFNIELAPDFTGINEIVQVEIFRIVQEAVTNINKHAAASKATVKVVFEGNCLLIYVADNGRGFDINELINKTKVGSYHLGLISIKERAQMLGGDFVLTSKPGEGTVVEVKIPPVGIMGSGLLWSQ